MDNEEIKKTGFEEGTVNVITEPMPLPVNRNISTSAFSAGPKTGDSAKKSGKGSLTSPGTLRVLSFALSMVSLIACCGIPSVITLFFSIYVLMKTKDDNDSSGKWMPIAGIILSGIGCLIILFALLAED